MNHILIPHSKSQPLNYGNIKCRDKCVDRLLLAQSLINSYLTLQTIDKSVIFITNALALWINRNRFQSSFSLMKNFLLFVSFIKLMLLNLNRFSIVHKQIYWKKYKLTIEFKRIIYFVWRCSFLKLVHWNITNLQIWILTESFYRSVSCSQTHIDTLPATQQASNLQTNIFGATKYICCRVRTNTKIQTRIKA